MSEFSGGEGDSKPVLLNKMTTGTDQAMVEVTENASESLPNRNIQRRRSQELEKARHEKQRDKSRPLSLFGDEASPNTRATRRTEKCVQKRMN